MRCWGLGSGRPSDAHSITLVVRAIVKLFCLVERENEAHWQILAFSISHDYRTVRIYGHYPVIDGKDIRCYRCLVQEFFFIALDGKEKWTAFLFRCRPISREYARLSISYQTIL